jgi:DNA primase large subunit
MTSVTTRFTPNDLAKYSFLKETAPYVKKLGLDLEELTSPELGSILNRAQERLEQSILSVYVGQRRESDVEIPSFPVAIMLAIATKNSSIKKRYALAEAKQAFCDLQLEPTERFLTITKDFDWTITKNEDPEVPFAFSVKFTDYLKNATHLRDEKWKLVNRPLVKDQVYISKHDAVRLLQEEIQRRILQLLDAKDLPAFPKKIMDIAESLNVLAKEHRLGEHGPSEFPKDVTQSAFPPCIVALHDSLFPNQRRRGSRESG